jgi:hypothetical protein
MSLLIELKRFEQPDEIREFEKGKFELAKLGPITIGARPTSPAGKVGSRVILSFITLACFDIPLRPR